MAIEEVLRHETMHILKSGPPPQIVNEKSPGHYCSVIINALNTRDFNFSSPAARDLLENHMSPTWSGKLNCQSYLVSFGEQLEVWRQMIMDFPDAQFELLSVDCDIRFKDRTADVIMRTAMIQGYERFLTACLLKWKFTGGRWVWYFHEGMRGIYDT